MPSCAAHRVDEVDDPLRRDAGGGVAERNVARGELPEEGTATTEDHRNEVDGDFVRQGRYDKGAVSVDTETRAEEACKRYRPPQQTGPDADFKNELARQFARCMREHGVEKFPDPNPDGSPNRIGEDITSDPQYHEAREFCTQQSNAAASRRPTPGASR